MIFRLAELRSTVSAIFPIDPAPLLDVIYERSDAFLERLKPKSTTWQGGDRTTLSAFGGSLRLSKSRTIPLHSIGITSVELTVTVKGPTSDAIDALREVWSWLATNSDEPGQELDDALFVHRTTSTFVSATLRDRMFPGLREMQTSLLTAAGVRQDSRAAFRVEVMADQFAHGLPLNAGISIEPRLTSKEEDNSFYSVSPLTSDKHIALLQRLCGADGSK